MPTFAIKVTQVYRTQRTITIEVEADDRESALENVRSGAIDLPAFDDPQWAEGWDLQNEEVA